MQAFRDPYSPGPNHPNRDPGLSAMQAFRVPLRIEKFSYEQGNLVPDCVEARSRPSHSPNRILMIPLW